MLKASSILRAPRSIYFGWGAVNVAGPAAAELGATAVLCTDEAVIDTASGQLLKSSLSRAGVATEVFAGTMPELPRPNIEECLDVARSAAADLVIGFGGGSSLDLAKVTALRLSQGGELDDYIGEGRVDSEVAAVVAIPTTAGTGSEVSPVAVIPDASGRTKVGISSPKLVPDVAICDPAVTLACPPRVTAYAGLDALIHAIESYTAGPRTPDWNDYPGPVFRGANPLTAPLALSAIELIGRSFERVLGDGRDEAARTDMLMGSLKAGLSFAQAGNAAAHALQYPIGARTATPHGLGVALLAPYVLQYVLPAAEGALCDIAKALAVDGRDVPPSQAAVDEIARLVGVGGVPTTLAELGVESDELGQLAAEAATIERLLRNSPRPLATTDLELILKSAWSGDRQLLKQRALP